MGLRPVLEKGDHEERDDCRRRVDLELVWESRKGWIVPLDATNATPWISHTATRPKQKAKKGARLASLAASPANLSKNPTLLDTSVGMRICLDSLLIHFSLQ